jgi:hypothetical protein
MFAITGRKRSFSPGYYFLRLSWRFSFNVFWGAFVPSFFGFAAPFIVTS